MSTVGPWEHDEVVIRHGRRSGVAVIAALHSQVLGPAIGGCRLRHYPDWSEGLADALRLSSAMTYKCAVSGVPFGGGKSVVALTADAELTPALRHAVLADLGELIASLDGRYVAGPDVGTGPADMRVLKQSTPHVFWASEEDGARSSSGPTATGVLAALTAGAEFVFGTGSMSGRTAVVVGLGAVGTHLASSLAQAGADVIVSDVDNSRRSLATECGFGWVEPAGAMHTSADVIIPAAVGGVLSADVAAAVDAPLIVGPANNQLTEDSVAEVLARRGVVWIPDLVASAGGVVYTIAREIDGLDPAAATRRVEGVGETVARLLAAAHAHGTTPLHEAMVVAEQRLQPATR